ncbi:MAG TPA: nuclear transport factor 2 family protein, partial [Anaerolineales bacterium]|nr:nuclear transport factor 2 family protein [Anaerolineales bacterium]
FMEADLAQANAQMPPTLRRFFGALRRGQLPDLIGLYASDAAQLSAHQTRYGLEAIAEFLKELLWRPDLNTLAVLDAAAAGEIYVVRWVLAPGRNS